MENALTTEERIAPADLVYQAICDLHSANKQASRIAIKNATGMDMINVDYHVKSLKQKDRISSPLPGVFEPVAAWDDRAVSSTVMSNSRVKLEIGEHVLDLTMREARNIVIALGGAVLVFGR